MRQSILIVDDEKHTREGIAAALEHTYEVFSAPGADEAARMMDSQRFDVVLTDLRIAGKDGMSVIDKALSLPKKPVCIMMTAYGSVDTAVEAMKRGAADFLTKPVNLRQLELVIARALKARSTEEENRSLHAQNAQLKKKLKEKTPDGFIGKSRALEQVIERVKQVAPSRANILITGETGTGKELIARMVHENSPRAQKPFVPVHCGAIPSGLLESELFGHEKGAFTGALEKRVGRFEAADGGTLFLDEVGEIAPEVQVKLLRFLETREFERLGSIKPIKVDVRLVCATHRDLTEMVRHGTFREDLFYRLNVVGVFLPPLREHAEDIPLLLGHYLKRFAQENDFPVPRLSSDALAALQAYAWPGNVRELRNFCENLVVTRPGETVQVSQLETRFAPAAASRAPMRLGLDRQENEKRLLREALVQSKGNRTKAAALTGLSRRTLHRKLLQWPELDQLGKDR